MRLSDGYGAFLVQVLSPTSQVSGWGQSCSLLHFSEQKPAAIEHRPFRPHSSSFLQGLLVNALLIAGQDEALSGRQYGIDFWSGTFWGS